MAFIQLSRNLIMNENILSEKECTVLLKKHAANYGSKEYTPAYWVIEAIQEAYAMGKSTTNDDAERYQYLRKNNLQIIPANMDGPAHPSLVFSFDIWSELPEKHNAEGLDEFIDIERGKL
jgi:hypothetical protein